MRNSEKKNEIKSNKKTKAPILPNHVIRFIPKQIHHKRRVTFNPNPIQKSKFGYLRCMNDLKKFSPLSKQIHQQNRKTIFYKPSTVTKNPTTPAKPRQPDFKELPI